jgi:hypothetical protein
VGTTCPTCGLDESTIAPTDVPVALRSYPRRFRALLTGFDEDEDADALVRRKPDVWTWSALACTAHAAEYFDAVADAIARMLVEDRPTLRLPEPDLAALEERASAEPVAAVLDRLAAAAERLAATCDAVPAGDWRRTATLPSGERDVLGVARTAVHEGHHHLRDVERILTAVRGRPPSSSNSRQ